ncbi:uncharacterized protein LOC130901840 isoform X1 [Diorhabda carinulata]|uniref:uncharacterized protein LOC130901840 isoform X1 n=1 Tax=Diorhabda carinulata TaxID=1163345 RepID=UPI0025A115CA|nr:uncharacterized protein LOC130901840 isoform X1 [Diorhabda carinulata]
MSVISPTDHFSGCFGILTKLNAKNTDNIKYSKTQFFQKVSKPSNSYDSSTRITVQTHKYQRVSTPESFVRTSKFQQKGIIFIWPQKKTHFRHHEVTFVAWIATHVLYWLYNLHVLPSGRVLPMKPPPWKFQYRIRKPDTRDYIIEPAWETSPISSTHSNY